MNKPIRALLLAAGLGTRLRPITLKTPKCLVEINNKTILEIWLDKLEKLNVEKTLINMHYMAEKVNKYLNEKYQKNKKIKKFFEENLYGTAGTLIANRKFFHNSIGLMIHADNYSFIELKNLIKAHNEKPKNCLLTMLTFDSNNPESCGIVEIDEKGIVINFYEKIPNPPGKIANGAVYVFEDNFLDWLIENHPNAKDFSTEILPFLKGKIFTYHTKLPYIDIGTPEKLKEAKSLKND